MKIFILGAGKVGRALASAFAEQGIEITLAAHRAGLPKSPIAASVIILALRDRHLASVATELANAGVVPKRAVVLHNAGSLSADVLAPLRPVCAGVAQMHPMISFASASFVPTLRGGNVHIQGDEVAVKRARTLAKKIGMVPRTISNLDPVGYHAAAALVANGAAALAALGEKLLSVAGVPHEDAPKMLGPLLRSVADNVEHLGLPDALTGPVRRGDTVAVRRQLDLLSSKLPEARLLFVASSMAQLPLAKSMNDANKEHFDEIESQLNEALRALLTR